MDKLYVHMWEEEVVIPTYGTGQPENNPMFFEKRVYQGSSGAVYPYPIIEKIYDEKTDKMYRAVFLENYYIKIMVLPQLGGRIQMAYDKIAGRHFVYYNEVIKPALVGLCGPWISGGIEFNWPQHHRPSTFSAIDCVQEENADGSKTVWVNEIEKMNGTKGMAGFTLYPGKAYIEVKARLFNRSQLPQTFLWWANPAVAVNDHYQSVFPPDVHAVYDHGKRDVSAFPVATGTYYKVDYAPGTDISRYKNIPVPTSYMAVNSVYDFVGGYEHDTAAGMLHVCSHHISPGKKQWTWGNGDFGKAWDRNLTDSNGPYAELMTGVYTDNQPDFSWIMPGERKSFEQYFLPYRELGMVKCASKDLALALELQAGMAGIRLFSTSAQAVEIQFWCSGVLQYREETAVAPEALFSIQVPVSAGAAEKDLLLVVTGADQRELLRYQPARELDFLPAAAQAPLPPQQIESTELLFLTGLHLEQYRHATFNAEAYYREALKRDAGDARCNNAMGLWWLRRGKAGKSEHYFRRAIETLTQYNANPYDGEVYYNLGCALQWQQRREEAYRAFYKAVWNNAWQAISYFALAQLDIHQRQFEKAWQHLDLALNGNGANNKALVLKAAVLRYLGKTDAAILLCGTGLKNDLFNLPLYFEKHKLYGAQQQTAAAAQMRQQVLHLTGGDSHCYIEYAIDYAHAGLFEEAAEWLLWALDSKAFSPLLYYYLGWNSWQLGKNKAAADWYAKAAAAPVTGCFPNRLEDKMVFEHAITLNPADAHAHYYLGCIWFDKRQYNDAIEHWHRAAHINQSLPVVWRNLGIAYYNKIKDAAKALQYFEKAFALHPGDARVLMELDQLYKRTGKPPAERLAFLEKNIELVLQRDDVYLERIALYNFLGHHKKAFELIMNRQFHPWEGGEGKVPAQYCFSLVQMAVANIKKQDYRQAIGQLEAAQVYPHNLGEGKLPGAGENDIFYLLGTVYEAMGSMQEALRFYRKATLGETQPAAAVFYNDPQPENMFYQGLAWQKLQENSVASHIFEDLLCYGRQHLRDAISIDFFAVSLPDLLVFDDDLDKRNTIHCTYMMALGQLGQKKYDLAAQLLQEVLAAEPAHAGACRHALLIPGMAQL